MTREFLEKFTKALWEEAHVADPYYVEELTLCVTDREVFVWHMLKVAQLHRLGRGLWPVVLEARG